MKTRHPKEASEAGMTLVEVMVAMAIFAIGVLAVGAMHVSSMRSTGTTLESTQASALAVDRMEKLMQMDYVSDNPALTAPDLTDTDNDGVGGLDDTGAAADRSLASGQYTLFWNLANNEPLDGTVMVRIIVVWTDRGVQRRYPLEFIKVDII